MKCDTCGINEATIHLAIMRGGQKTEKHLCPSCAQKEQAAGFLGLIKPVLNLNLPGAIPLSELMNDGTETPREQERTCSGCGMSFSAFRKTGLLGCAQCYESFREELEPILTRIHGRTEHCGMTPETDMAALEKKRKLDELTRRMNEAVAKEAFEEAARLRDEIKALKAESEEPKQTEGMGQ